MFGLLSGRENLHCNTTQHNSKQKTAAAAYDMYDRNHTGFHHARSIIRSSVTDTISDLIHW